MLGTISDLVILIDPNDPIDISGDSGMQCTFLTSQMNDLTTL